MGRFKQSAADSVTQTQDQEQPVAAMSSSSTGDDAALAALIQQTPVLDPVSYKEKMKLSKGNVFHRYLDYGLGGICYFFSSAMFAKRQSSGLTMAGMWFGGTYLILNGNQRAEEGPSRALWQAEAVSCWLWMFSSFRSFSQYRVMKFCGASSMTGLLMAGYYSTMWFFSWAASEE